MTRRHDTRRRLPRSLDTGPRVVVTVPLLASLARLFRSSKPSRWMNG